MNLPKPVKLVNLPNLVNLDQTSNFPPSSSSFSSSSSSVWPRVAVRWYQQVNATSTQGTYRKLHRAALLHNASHFFTLLHTYPHCTSTQGTYRKLHCSSMLHTSSHFPMLVYTFLHCFTPIHTVVPHRGHTANCNGLHCAILSSLLY